MTSDSKIKQPRVLLGLSAVTIEDGDSQTQDVVGALEKTLDIFQEFGHDEIEGTATSMREKSTFTQLTRWKERGLKLSTRVAYPEAMGGTLAERVTRALEKNLEDLGTESVDVMYLHRPQTCGPLIETLRAVNSLHKTGKFSSFGLSNFNAAEITGVIMICTANEWALPSRVEVHYNCFEREVETEVINVCRRYNLQIIVRNPIPADVEAARRQTISPAANCPLACYRAIVDDLSRKMNCHDPSNDAASTLETLSKEHGIPAVDIAYRWLIHHSKLDAIAGDDAIVMNDPTEEYCTHDLKAVQGDPLSPEIVDVLQSKWSAIEKHRQQLNKRKCFFPCSDAKKRMPRKNDEKWAVSAFGFFMP